MSSKRRHTGKTVRHLTEDSQFGRKEYSELADTWICADWTPPQYDGPRGAAKAKRGAKKKIRARVRFHENAATKKLALELDCECD